MNFFKKLLILVKGRILATPLQESENQSLHTH
jgi:hypothetical protein